MAWILSWVLPILNGMQVFYILLFPTGRLPSRRWRWLGWLTVAFVLVGGILAAFSSGALLGILGPIQNPLGIEGFSNTYYKAILFTMTPLLTLAAALAVFIPPVPIAIGIAILRYRLYDIDLLINRTLVYGSLTALLVLVYFGGVTATQAIFRALSGQGSTLAVVVSTLVIAA